MGCCYSVQVDINPESNPAIVYELEVYHVYNYNEDPVNYDNKELVKRIYEDNF
jgi:hypothetical protein